MKAIVALVMSIWLTALVPWFGTSAVLAGGTANCSEALISNRWLGQQSASSSQRHGAKATFENWSLVQCTNPGLVEISGSEVWTNLIPTDGSDWDILQIGAGNCRAPVCHAGMYYYWGGGLRHTTPGCSQFQDSPPVNNGISSWTAASHTYAVQHASNVYNLQIDGVTKVVMAESAVCWTPRSAVWFGESWDYGDQIGGTYYDHLTVSNAQYQTSEGGGWVNTSFNAASPCNYVATHVPFECDVTGAQSFDMWTDR